MAGRSDYSSNVTVANEYTLFGAGSVYGQINAGIVAVEVKIGAEVLHRRTTVTICAHPDNSGYVYVGLDSDVSSTKYFYVLTGGEAVGVTLDSLNPPELWIMGSAANQYVGVVEGVD